MPTYIYRREDGSTFEVQQRITEDPLQTCPDTGQKVSRVISGSAGLIFKGSGFYLTDYARKSSSNGSTSSTSDAKPAGDTGSSTEKTPAPKAEKKAESSEPKAA